MDTSTGSEEREDVDQLMSEINDLINLETEKSSSSFEESTNTFMEEEDNEADAICESQVVVTNKDSFVIKESSGQEGADSIQLESDQIKETIDALVGGPSSGKVSAHKTLVKLKVKGNTAVVPVASSSKEPTPAAVDKLEDIPSCSKAESAVSQHSGQVDIECRDKHVVVLLTKLDPGVTSFQVKPDGKAHARSSEKPHKSSSSSHRKATRKTEVKKSAWYDDDAPLSDISVSDIEISDGEEQKDAMPKRTASEKSQKAKSSESSGSMRQEVKQKLDVVSSDIMEALKATHKGHEKDLPSRKLSKEKDVARARSSSTDHKHENKDHSLKDRKRDQKKHQSVDRKNDVEDQPKDKTKPPMVQEEKTELDIKQKQTDSEKELASAFDTVSNAKQSAVTSSSTESLHGEMGKKSKVETHTPSVSADSTVASKKHKGEEKTGKGKKGNSQADITSHKSKTVHSNSQKPAKRHRELSEGDGKKAKKSCDETLDKIIPKPEPVKETETHKNNMRYQLSLRPVSLSDLSNESFRKFVNLALDCAVQFKKRSSGSNQAFGHVDLFFGDYTSLHSAMQRLSQLSSLADNTWVRGTIRCFELPTQGKPKQKDFWKNTASAKLFFEFCAGKTDKLQQLTAYRDRKKEGTKGKSAQLHRVPAAISQEMLTLLFPFSLAVKISGPDTLEKGLKGPVDVDFESAEWMEAVFTCFREFAVMPKVMTKKSFHLMIKNFTFPKDKSSERQPPPVGGSGKTRLEPEKQAGFSHSAQDKNQPRNRGQGLSHDRNQDQGRTSRDRPDQRKRPYLEVHADNQGPERTGRSPGKRGRFDSAGPANVPQRSPADPAMRRQSQQAATISSEQDRLRQLAMARGLDPNNPDVLKILEMSAHLETLQMMVKHQTAQASSLGITGLHAQQDQERQQQQLAMEQGRNTMDSLRLQAQAMQAAGRLPHMVSGESRWPQMEHSRQLQEARLIEEERRQEEVLQKMKQEGIRREEEKRRSRMRWEEERMRGYDRRREEDRGMHDQFEISQAEKALKEKIASKMKMLGEIEGKLRKGSRNNSPNAKGLLETDQKSPLKSSMAQAPYDGSVGGAKRVSPLLKGIMKKGSEKFEIGSRNVAHAGAPPHRWEDKLSGVPRGSPGRKRGEDVKDRHSRGSPMGARQQLGGSSFERGAKQLPVGGRPQKDERKPGESPSRGRADMPRVGNNVEIPIHGRGTPEVRAREPSSSVLQQGKAGTALDRRVDKPGRRPPREGMGGKRQPTAAASESMDMVGDIHSTPFRWDRAERGGMMPRRSGHDSRFGRHEEMEGLPEDVEVLSRDRLPGRGGISPRGLNKPVHGPQKPLLAIPAEEGSPVSYEELLLSGKSQPGAVRGGPRGRGHQFVRGQMRQEGSHLREEALQGRFSVSEHVDSRDPGFEDFGLHGPGEVAAHGRGRGHEALRGQGFSRGRGGHNPGLRNHPQEWLEQEPQEEFFPEENLPGDVALARGRGRAAARGQGLPRGRGRHQPSEEHPPLMHEWSEEGSHVAEEFLPGDNFQGGVAHGPPYGRGRGHEPARGRGLPRGQRGQPKGQRNPPFSADWSEEGQHFQQVPKFEPNSDPNNIVPDEDYNYTEEQNYSEHPSFGQHDFQQFQQEWDENLPQEEEVEEGYLPDDLIRRKPWLNADAPRVDPSHRGLPHSQGRELPARGGRLAGPSGPLVEPEPIKEAAWWEQTEEEGQEKETGVFRFGQRFGHHPYEEEESGLEFEGGPRGGHQQRGRGGPPGHARARGNAGHRDGGAGPQHGNFTGRGGGGGAGPQRENFTGRGGGGRPDRGHPDHIGGRGSHVGGQQAQGSADRPRGRGKGDQYNRRSGDARNSRGGQNKRGRGENVRGRGGQGGPAPRGRNLQGRGGGPAAAQSQMKGLLPLPGHQTQFEAQVGGDFLDQQPPTFDAPPSAAPRGPRRDQRGGRSNQRRGQGGPSFPPPAPLAFGHQSGVHFY